MREIIIADPAVGKVGDLLPCNSDPANVLLAGNIQFKRRLNLQELESAIERLFIEDESFKRTSECSSKAA